MDNIRIIKAGVLDTVQDMGRHGYQQLGINPGGAMDRWSAQAANMSLKPALAGPMGWR